MSHYNDEDFVDQATEAYQDELGAAYGDPRRCPRHPHVHTSSPDGMFDGLCYICEGEMDDERPLEDARPLDASDDAVAAEYWKEGEGRDLLDIFYPVVVDASEDDIPF